MSTVLRVRLTGAEAELGRVAAGDVARMLLGVERAVARAAGHLIGRQVKATGRRGRTIEESTRFRLVGIEGGSVVGVLELPAEAPEDRLDVDVASLGDLAVDAALATAAGEETEHVDVADAFVRLSDDLGVGTRFDALTIEEERPGERRTVTLDRPARERLWELVASAPRSRDDSLVGVLVEADFERHTARLRTVAGQGITVRFEPDLADTIHEVLRRQTEIVGEVTYDPKTMEARSVNLREIVRSEQLTMGLEESEFWTARSIADIAAERGVGPVDDVEVLRDHEASDEEVDRVLAALDEM
jgi:hypothetical protein